ncbi:MAG: sulfotransferase domain-containing protein [Planctomycetota bacterium]
MSADVPDFLIIGAMKSGTTTLFSDLHDQRGYFAPIDKEPEAFNSDHILTDKGLGAYLDLFKAARPDQLCYEASTGYTKFPEYSGVTERIRSVYADRLSQLRVIYIVRDPIKRIISQHYHEYSSGLVGPDADAEIKAHPRYVNWSKYAMQLKPWHELLGSDRVLTVIFEEYISDRVEGVRRVCEFLGGPFEPSSVGIDRVMNRSEGKLVHTRLSSVVGGSKVYRKLIRPSLNGALKEKLKGLLQQKSPPRPPGPSEETVTSLESKLREDMEQFVAMIGRREPIWRNDC